MYWRVCCGNASSHVVFQRQVDDYLAEEKLIFERQLCSLCLIPVRQQGLVMLRIGLVLSDGMITAYLTDPGLPCSLQSYLM